MRKLFILRGAPGCGKSSFVNKYNLENHTLSLDAFRKIFCPVSPVMGNDGLGYSIMCNSHTTTKIVNAMNDALVSRMELGDFVVIDGMNLTHKAIRPYVNLAREYGYKVFMINIQGDMSDEELLRRNKNRPSIDQIDEEVILKKASIARQPLDHSSVTEIPLSEVTNETFRNRVNVENVGNRPVAIFGDVQSCAIELCYAFYDLSSRGVRDFIFVGDLFDRGDDAYGVYKLFLEMRNRFNVTLVEGNHETNLLKVVNNASTASGKFRDTRESRKQMLDNGVYSDELRKNLLDVMTPVHVFVSGGKNFIVTHGGTSRVGTTGVMEDSHGKFVYADHPVRHYTQGISSRLKTYNGQSNYAGFMGWLSLPEGIDGQFFGHRSGAAETPPENVIQPPHYGLESRVEFGGPLTVAVVQSGEVELHYYSR